MLFFVLLVVLFFICYSACVTSSISGRRVDTLDDNQEKDKFIG